MKTRSLALDVLRIYAALWVVLFHWSKLFWSPVMPDWASSFARAGYLGVDIFFILSGAVISFTAVGRSWSDFGKARFLRLFPAYFLVTLVTVMVVPIVRDWKPLARDWLSFTGVQLWSGAGTFVAVAWTLYFEVAFYALMTVLIIVMRKKLTADMLRNGVFVFLALSLVAMATDNGVLKFLTLQPYSGHFAFGVLLGISKSTSTLRRNLPALLVAAALAFQSLADRTIELNLAVPVQISLILVIIFGCVSFIVWSTLRTPSEARHPGIHRATTTLALMTYPLYLIHQDFGLSLAGAFALIGWPRRAAAPVSALVVALICWASVRFFEPYARGLLSRVFLWTKGGPSPQPASPGVAGAADGVDQAGPAGVGGEVAQEAPEAPAGASEGSRDG